jgi:hypothetical protein
VVEEPMVIVTSALTVATGEGFTVRTIVIILSHPLEVVSVSVYVPGALTVIPPGKV